MGQSIFQGIALILILAQLGCGFQLRGSNPAIRSYEFTSLYIDSSLPIANRLRALLALDSRVKVMPSADSAELVLRVNDPNRTKRILTISRNGRLVSEYRLNYSLTAQAWSHGIPLALDLEIRQFRDLKVYQASILGKVKEEELLWRDMEQTIAQQLLYWLSSQQMSRAITAVSISDSASAR